ncbi:hypothetical protein [Myxococcus landrumensis]|uniref:Uncharacterized protein n=1 Tax=Myxococcus landrumensis TaxID=2813577 RepID=A0ABX7NEH3_9BACT|nr:hypothetical protein [Myxococcus landrumus]QSQ17222.1 hypothetical protein JY572_14675 [Myxococcus landrumus]
MRHQKPTVGSIVLFVLPEGPSREQARAAIITNIHGEEAALHVFLDHVEDGLSDLTAFVPRAKLGGPDQPGTWFWPTIPTPASKVSAPAYTPPDELVESARLSLAAAMPSELDAAVRAYRAYGSVTDGRSAVTGAELPAFDACPPLVQAGWLAVARLSLPPRELGSGS